MTELKNKIVKVKNKQIHLSWRSWQVLDWVLCNPKVSTASIVRHFRGLDVKESNAEIEAILSKLYQTGILTLVNNLWTSNGKIEKVS